MTIRSLEDACGCLDIEYIKDPSVLTKDDADNIVKLFAELALEDDAPISDLIHSKNILLFEIMKNESDNGKIYKFNFISNDKCKFCGGSGLNPIMEIGVIPNMDKCFDCLGTGLLHQECPRCFGDGWIRGQKCIACDGKKRIQTKHKAKCIRCNGKRYLDRKVNTGRLLTHCKCSVCRGIGLIK